VRIGSVTSCGEANQNKKRTAKAQFSFCSIDCRWDSGIETAFRLQGGSRSVYKVDDCAVAAVQESNELPEIRRGHVVVHGIEISVIGDVQ
jgi:hypothetical protein